MGEVPNEVPLVVVLKPGDRRIERVNRNIYCWSATTTNVQGEEVIVFATEVALSAVEEDDNLLRRLQEARTSEDRMQLYAKAILNKLGG